MPSPALAKPAPSPSLPPSSGGEWVLDISEVSKTYKGKVHALRGIDMRVRRGEVFGLLGPNGAGKSTLVKILMTVISPTRAKGTMLGEPVGTKRALAKVGYLPEHHRFPDYLTGAQVVDFYGALAGVPRSDRKARIPRLLDLVGMREWANTKVRGYSKGMRQRVGIAQALINEPDLVLLDEPTDGVDPVGRRDIRDIIHRLRNEGKSVFINSHLLSELEAVSDRVAILVQGRVAKQGDIDELTAGKRYYELELDPADDATLNAVARSIPANVTHERAGSTLRIYTENAAIIQPVLDAARFRAAVIKSLRPVRPSLEDLFMEAVTDPTTGQALPPGAIRPASASAGKAGSR